MEQKTYYSPGTVLGINDTCNFFLESINSLEENVTIRKKHKITKYKSLKENTVIVSEL